MNAEQLKGITMIVLKTLKAGSFQSILLICKEGLQQPITYLSHNEWFLNIKIELNSYTQLLQIKHFLKKFTCILEIQVK